MTWSFLSLNDASHRALSPQSTHVSLGPLNSHIPIHTRNAGTVRATSPCHVTILCVSRGRSPPSWPDQLCTRAEDLATYTAPLFLSLKKKKKKLGCEEAHKYMKDEAVQANRLKFRGTGEMRGYGQLRKEIQGGSITFPPALPPGLRNNPDGHTATLSVGNIGLPCGAYAGFAGSNLRTHHVCTYLYT